MKPASAPRASGFTLVEIMIGLLIGMIGIVVIMQTFSVSEGYKRTSTSGSDAQVNGGLALYLLEREIRLAGYGVNSLTPMGCTSIVVYNAKSGTTSSMRMVPFEINPAGIPAGDPGTDTILITYGSAENFVTGVGADQPSNSSANYQVQNNRDAFQPGDLVIAVQPGGGAGGGPSCVMQELTGVPSASSCGSGGGNGSSELIHNTGKYKNPNKGCEMSDPVYNKPSGITDPATGQPVPKLDASNGGTIFDIGPLPQVKAYAIRGGNLTSCDLMTTDCSVAANFSPMVSGIVSMRAVYGKDPDSNGSVDAWDRNALATSADANSVIAAAIEVTAKSGLKEKPSAGSGTCDTTSDAARPDPAQDWFGYNLAAASQIDLSGTAADWQCYRYKLFQTRVPLRNMIWRP
jgi:type IV pilus assembly protein PilW